MDMSEGSVDSVYGDWSRLQARLAQADFEAGRLLVGLDFDGTLAEIVDRPAEAALAAETRRLLRLISRRPDTKIAILSGRALEDVRRLVAMPEIYYAGNHGLEIHGPGIRWTHPKAQDLGNDLGRALADDLREFPGAFVEHKRLGIALHYRKVPARHLGRLRDKVRARLAGLKERFRFLRGKKTFDLRPDIPWDKGHALETIRRTLSGGWMAVFIGDDATDEEAFQTIGPRALTVRVGRVKTSAAQYVIPRRMLVDRLLETLARRSGASARAR